MNISSLLLGKVVSINDAQYVIVNPNNLMAECVSFYNNENKTYLRHYAKKIIESGIELNVGQFSNDSSFVAEISKGGVCFHCSNQGMENNFISLNTENEVVVDDKLEPICFSTLQQGNSILNRDILIYDLTTKLSSLNKDLADLKNKYRLDISCSKLRDISKRIKKINRVVFVGTGKLGENTQYAFIKLCEIVKNKALNLELRYFARNDIEKEYFDKKGYPCEIWSSLNYENIEFALLAKVAVFSTHTLADNYSNCVLSSALFGSYKIQLWHGFLAKMVGSATLANRQDIVRISNMLEDTCVDVVCVAILTDQISSMYRMCFPGASIVQTGDARTDALYQKQTIRKKLTPFFPKKVRGKPSEQNTIRILISPTYRESKLAAKEYINSVTRLVSKLPENVKVSIKFHPIYFSRFELKEKELVIESFTKKNIEVISEREDSYAIMADYDALITDYSSIRFDFLITGKPVLLFRPDYDSYVKLRRINPIIEFDEIDNISYSINENSIDEIYESVTNDPKETERLNYLDKINLKRDGRSSERVANLLLSKIFNNEK